MFILFQNFNLRRKHPALQVPHQLSKYVYIQIIRSTCVNQNYCVNSRAAITKISTWLVSRLQEKLNPQTIDTEKWRFSFKAGIMLNNNLQDILDWCSQKRHDCIVSYNDSQHFWLLKLVRVTDRTSEVDKRRNSFLLPPWLADTAVDTKAAINFLVRACFPPNLRVNSFRLSRTERFYLKQKDAKIATQHTILIFLCTITLTKISFHSSDKTVVFAFDRFLS